MIDVSELLIDPDFAEPFWVCHKQGRWVKGRFEEMEEKLSFYGPVQPPNTRDLEQIPEADRLKGIMNFLSTEEIRLTCDEGNSDEVEWRGERYKIIQVKTWPNWNRATGVKI